MTALNDFYGHGETFARCPVGFLLPFLSVVRYYEVAGPC